jgi:hypothetical protein
MLVCPVSELLAPKLKTELPCLLPVLSLNYELQNSKLSFPIYFLSCLWIMSYRTENGLSYMLFCSVSELWATKLKTELPNLLPVPSLNYELQNWKLNFPIYFQFCLWTLSFKTKNWALLFTFCPVSELWATELKMGFPICFSVLSLNYELQNWKLNLPIVFLSRLWTMSYKTEHWTFLSTSSSGSELWATKLKTELPVLSLNYELQNWNLNLPNHFSVQSLSWISPTAGWLQAKGMQTH